MPTRKTTALASCLLTAVGCGAGIRLDPSQTSQDHAINESSAMVPTPRATPAEASPAPEVKVEYTPDSRDVVTPAFAIDDPTGTALNSFYGALAQTDEGGAKTRVSHFGDSSIGQDGLPHELRKRFQNRFGDAGAGFVLLHRYSNNYLNRVVKARSQGDWQVCYIAYGCRPDGHYGYGGHVFTARRGVSASFATKNPDQLGGQVSSFEVWYQAWPRGGTLTISVDGEQQAVLDTRSPTLEDRYHRIEVPLGQHRLDLKPGAAFRGYGVVMESSGPGVVWDSMSMIGAFTKRLLFFADAHISGQVTHRDPDLIVLNYGGNDLRRIVNRSVYPERFREEVAAAISRMRLGKPEASCLVVGVIDHGRSGTHQVKPKHVEVLVNIQREVAIAQGCAFFDSYRAMGGAGSIHRWRKQGLASGDLKHLTARGRARMAGYMYDALITGYVAYRRQHPVREVGEAREVERG